MYFIKFNTAINFLRNNKLDSAYNLISELINIYPNKPELYTLIAKVYLRKNDLQNCKKYLLSLVSLNKWYNKKIVTEILEITNWKMLVPNKYFCKEPSFSYDGDKITFVCATEDTNNDGRINVMDRGGIYIINRNGENMQCVIPNEYYNSLPRFSPDGKYLIYLSARRDTNGDGVIDNLDNAGLYLYDLTKDEEKLLVEDSYKPKHPSFSPDGTKVIFTCWKTPTSYSGVYEIELGTMKMNTLVSEWYENAFPSYSPNGTRIIFSSWRGTDTAGASKGSGIYIRDIKTQEETMLCPSNYINSFPIFSNDGTKVAFLSKRRDTNNDKVIDSLDNDGIYIYDLNKRKEYCVHSDNFYNKYINFTKDSKYLIFLSNWHRKKEKDIIRKDYFELKGIYKCNLRGKKLKQIVSDKYYGCNSPCVSPTRKEVVYTSFKKNTARGLYLAYIDRLPDEEEIIDIIKKNL